MGCFHFGLILYLPFLPWMQFGIDTFLSFPVSACLALGGIPLVNGQSFHQECTFLPCFFLRFLNVLPYSVLSLFHVSGAYHVNHDAL